MDQPADGLARALSTLDDPPLISLVIPVLDDEHALRITLDSIQAQIYRRFQITFTSSPAATAPTWAADLRQLYPFTIEIAEPGRSLGALKGVYVTVVFPGDALSPDALGQVALAAGAEPPAVIYADENNGRPLFKPDWSPDFLLSTDYLGRAVFYHRDWLMRAGGVGETLCRASLYDLNLRITEICPPPLHIPRILLTCQEEATDSSVNEAMSASLQSAILRRGLSGEVSPVKGHPGFYILHARPPVNSLVSILIATHDQPELLQKCLHSVFTQTRDCQFEVVLVDHQSQRDETRAVIVNWSNQEPHRFRCLPYTGEFNFSKINNFAAARARGDLLLLLNNDTEVINPHWLSELAGAASRPTSGAVGAALEYPDGRIQHGGIVMGVDDLAVHAFKDLPTEAPGYMNRLLVPSNFLAVTGACLMVRTSVYHALGGLSEDYAVAGGDIDFCLRAAQKGMYNILLPHVRLLHHESATRGFEDSYQKFSRLQKELDQLSHRWPDYAIRDPYYHPCLDGKGKFTIQI